MIKTEELKTNPAGMYAYVAARDAHMRNVVNSSKFTDQEKLKAERVKLGLEMVYVRQPIFVNYRQKFITVKICDSTIRDNKNLNLLEQDYSKDGITKIVTDTGIVYRIPKN